MKIIEMKIPNGQGQTQYDIEKEKELPLAQRDIYLLQIEEEIKNRKGLLIKKKKQLDKKEKVNIFLQEVKNDYTNYYNYIVKEKQNQYQSLLLLKEYMDDLMSTNNLMDTELRTAKHDQKDILREIDKIKVELNEITNK